MIVQPMTPVNFVIQSREVCLVCATSTWQARAHTQSRSGDSCLSMSMYEENGDTRGNDSPDLSAAVPHFELSSSFVDDRLYWTYSLSVLLAYCSAQNQKQRVE